MTKKQLLQLQEINDHRTAVGRSKFKSLTENEIKYHLSLINKSAPFGDDPWLDYVEPYFVDLVYLVEYFNLANLMNRESNKSYDEIYLMLDEVLGEIEQAENNMIYVNYFNLNDLPNNAYESDYLVQKCINIIYESNGFDTNKNIAFILNQ